MDAQLSTAAESAVTTEERNWAMAAHLSALVAVVGLPFGHIVGPLIVYLVKHKESAFVAGHARSSLNYQITVSLALILAVVLGIVVFGAVIVFAGLTAPAHEQISDSMAGSVVVLWVGLFMAVASFFIVSLIFIIMGTIAAGAGKPYTYPFAIKFVH